MQRRDFIRQAGLILGGIPAVGAAAVAAALRPGVAVLCGAPDWADVRDQFPLTRSRIHMATFLLTSHPRPVAEAIERHRRAFDEDPASYWHEHFRTAEPEQRAAAAEYLGANSDDIALTDSTTMGLGLIYGTIRLEPGQEVLTTTHDHYVTQLALRHRADRTGATVRQVALYEDGASASVDEIVSRMRDALADRTRVLAVTWVHSSTGVKLPLAEMSGVLREVNASRDAGDQVLFCVDGVHGFGIDNVTVDELGCDFFMAGTHKWLFGPRGTGIIWGRHEAWETASPIVPSFGTPFGAWIGELTPEKVQVGDLFTPGGFHSFEHRWALAEAFRFHLALGKERVQERIHALNTLTKAALAEMPHVRLHTPKSPELSAGIIAFEVDGYTPEQVVERLHEDGIIATVSPYHVSYARLAPSLINNEEEVRRTMAAIAAMN